VAASDSVDKYRTYAISPDGGAFAAVLNLNGPPRVQVLEIKDGSERVTIFASDEYVTSVMFSPDSSTLLTAAGFTDSTIRLWDAHTGKAKGSLEGHRSFVSDLLFTPDGKRLISSSGDQTIRLWDWTTRQPVGILRGHLTEVDGLALAPDGRTLGSRCKDGSLYLWDISKPSRHLGYQTLASHTESGKVEFTPDSRYIFAAQASGNGVVEWDAITLKETRHSNTVSTNYEGVFFLPDANQVARFDFHARLQVWDVRSGLGRTNYIAATNYFVADFLRNGRCFITGRKDGTNFLVETWDTDTWQRKGLFITRSKGVHDLIGTPLPNTFAIVKEGGLLFFDATKPNETPRQIECQGYFYGLTLSPDGRTLATAYGESFVQLWDVSTLQPVEKLSGFLLGVHSVAYSPDGKRLAAGSDGQEAVKLWDTETRQEVLTLSGEGSVFFVLKFSPDGRYLLAANFDGVIHLWSAPSWEEIKAAEMEDATARN